MTPVQVVPIPASPKPGPEPRPPPEAPGWTPIVALAVRVQQQHHCQGAVVAAQVVLDWVVLTTQERQKLALRSLKPLPYSGLTVEVVPESTQERRQVQSQRRQRAQDDQPALVALRRWKAAQRLSVRHPMVGPR